MLNPGAGDTPISPDLARGVTYEGREVTVTRTLDIDPVPLQCSYGKSSGLALERGPGTSCLEEPGSFPF